MSKVLTTLRTHWKKSIFLTAAAGYGLHYGHNKWEDRQVMKAFCQEALRFGEVPQPNSAPLYRVTVILNPAASKGSARTKFEKYCAPILNLAGIKVSVIRTEGEGQAKEIVEILEDADALLVAGGDGTVMEAVTGLMRRPDARRLGMTLPIGVLPVGNTNRLARTLFPDVSTDRSEVELMATAAMSCVRQLYRPMDVMMVENISQDTEFSGKKIYGMTEFQLGALRDAHDRMPKYWYWAGLKKAATYVFGFTSSAKEILWHCNGNLGIAREAAAANSSTQAEAHNVPSSGQKRTWWDFFHLPRRQSAVAKAAAGKEEVRYDWETSIDDFDGIEVRIRSPSACSPLKGAPTSKNLDVELGPSEVSFSQYITQGWRRETVFQASSGEKEEDSSSSSQGWRVFSAPAVRFYPTFNDDKERFFSLDDEAVEVKGPLEVSLLPDKVVMFCSKVTRLAVPRDGKDGEANSKWWQNKGRTIAHLDEIKRRM